MKVHQLKDLLNLHAANEFEVIVEGCDCEAEAGGIIIRKDEKTVVITRNDTTYTRPITPTKDLPNG